MSRFICCYSERVRRDGRERGGLRREYSCAAAGGQTLEIRMGRKRLIVSGLQAS